MAEAELVLRAVGAGSRRRCFCVERPDEARDLADREEQVRALAAGAQPDEVARGRPAGESGGVVAGDPRRG